MSSDHFLYWIASSESRSLVGNLKYREVNGEDNLVGLTTNDLVQKFVFFLKSRGNGWGARPETRMFISNYDGTGFKQIRINATSMKVSLTSPSFESNPFF
jgi:hypothetical protein